MIRHYLDLYYYLHILNEIGKEINKIVFKFLKYIIKKKIINKDLILYNRESFYDFVDNVYDGFFIQKAKINECIKTKNNNKYIITIYKNVFSIIYMFLT